MSEAGPSTRAFGARSGHSPCPGTRPARSEPRGGESKGLPAVAHSVSVAPAFAAEPLRWATFA